MNAIRDGLKRSFANSDWTLISLGVFCILPVVWWDVVHMSLPIRPTYLIEFGVSILVWVVASQFSFQVIKTVFLVSGLTWIGLLVASVLIVAATGIVLIQLSSNMDVPHTSENVKEIG